MAYRLIELTAPADRLEEAKKLLNEEEILHSWSETIDDERGLLRVLLEAAQTEKLMDTFSERFEGYRDFRLLLFAVEATLPRPEQKEKEKQEGQEVAEPAPAGERISREELYADIEENSRFSRTYVATIVLSVLVASVGLINDSVAVIIGAMVIAPLLGPNVSLSLASALGDLPLAWRSLKTGAGGMVIALALSFGIGMIWSVDPEANEIASRTVVGIGDVVIALAAGSAGVLSFTRGVSAAIIGVMVAVALLPPLVNLGLLLGSGLYALAFGAMVLVIVNVICINLAGVLTFFVQGIRPRTWWEEQKAKKALRTAIMIWVVLLLMFTFVILYWW